MSDTEQTTAEKLRLRANNGETLSAEEQAIIGAFYSHIEKIEATCLTPVNERLREDDTKEEYLRELELVRDKLQIACEQYRLQVGEIEVLLRRANVLLAEATVASR